MYLKALLVGLMAVLLSQVTLAKENFTRPDSELVIKSCKEVVEIYKSRDEKRLLASQTTSLIEALRAGYCIGLLSSTSCESKYRKTNWFIAAKRIAELDPSLKENHHASPDDVLAYGACP
jgi:hypothetical protein